MRRHYSTTSDPTDTGRGAIENFRVRHWKDRAGTMGRGGGGGGSGNGIGIGRKVVETTFLSAY